MRTRGWGPDTECVRGRGRDPPPPPIPLGGVSGSRYLLSFGFRAGVGLKGLGCLRTWWRTGGYMCKSPVDSTPTPPTMVNSYRHPYVLSYCPSGLRRSVTFKV